MISAKGKNAAVRGGENSLVRRITLRQSSWTAVVASAYFAAHQIGFLFPDTEQILMTIWPAGGIGLAALLLSPRRLWPVLLAAIFVAGNSANLLIGRPLLNSVGFMTANVLESYGAAWVITRYCGGKAVRFAIVPEITALILAATVVNALTALIGAGTAALSHLAPFWIFWRTWWIADGLGLLLIAPLIVTWRHCSGVRWTRAVEATIFTAIWVVVASMAFHEKIYSIRLGVEPYIPVALLTWAALRLGQRMVAVSLVLLGIVAITSHAVTVGPFIWGGENLAERVLLLQTYLACTAVAGFYLAAGHGEAKAAERSAREEHARLRSLGDNLPDGMVYQVVREHDGTMRFVYVSSGVAQLCGVSADVVLKDASTLYDLTPEEDRLTVAAAHDESAAKLTPFQSVVRFRRPDGALRWMRLSSMPRRMADGRVLWDGIQTDITQQKKAEEERLKLVHRLEQVKKAESLARMAGSIAHHVNNMMGVVIGNLDMALDDVSDRPSVTKPLVDALTASNRVVDISGLMLLYLGQSIRKNERLDLGAVIRQALTTWEDSATIGTRLTLDVPTGGPFVEGDSAQIAQIVAALCTNAKEAAADNDGTIHVSLCEVASGEVDGAHFHPPDFETAAPRYARVEIKDTGCGMAAEVAEKIFDPFFSTRFMGRGLGLALVQGMVRAHGGAISVESAPGRGTTFRVFCPMT